MRRRFAVLFMLALTAVLTLAAALPAAAHHRFPEQIDLPNGWRPEGITSGRGTTFFVGSLADGGIWQGDLRTGNGDEIIEEASGPAVGIDYEKRGRHTDRLWVAGGPSHEVRVYDVDDAELLATYAFESGFLNDVVVTRRAVYVTDSNVQQLIVIPLGRHGQLPDQADTFTLPLTGEIAYTDGFNANGIDEAHGWLIIVQSNTGQLFRVHPWTGEATAIDTGDYSVTAGDGLEVRGKWLWVVRNQFDLVAVFRLSDRLLSARLIGEITSDGLDVPTTATLNAGRLWAVNARFTTPPTPDTEYWVTRLPARP